MEVTNALECGVFKLDEMLNIKVVESVDFFLRSPVVEVSVLDSQNLSWSVCRPLTLVRVCVLT